MIASIILLGVSVVDGLITGQWDLVWAWLLGSVVGWGWYAYKKSVAK